MLGLPQNIAVSQIMLSPEIPLYVYLVKGENFSAFIDSGVKTMFAQLKSQLQTQGGLGSLKFVLHTHSHHDHIGCNAQLKQLTGCLIAAHPYYESWHRDFNVHYHEFALNFPDIIGDSPELKNEVFEPLDGEVPLDIMIREGTTIELGGGSTLDVYEFPGHMKAELGFLEHKHRTLILGDAITGLDWDIFHSHLDVQAYRNSLNKIRSVIVDEQVETVLLSHFGPNSPDETLGLIEHANAYLDRIEYTMLKVFVDSDGVTSLGDLWQGVCSRMARKPDFRALNMIQAHLEDMSARGIVTQTSNRNYKLCGAPCQ